MCEREEGCHSLNAACLKSCNGPTASPAGTLLSSSAATVGVFSSPILWLRTASSSFSHRLISPWKCRLSHIWLLKRKVPQLHGGAVSHSRQLADTQAGLCWDPLCSSPAPSSGCYRGSHSCRPSSLHRLFHQVKTSTPMELVGNSLSKCLMENAASLPQHKCLPW